MNINFNPKSLFKWSLILVLMVFVGYMLGELTYKTSLIMLITLFVAIKA